MNRVPKAVSIFILIALVTLSTSCHIMFIGAYDQVTDSSIQQVQNEISTLLVAIEKNIEDKTPQSNKYENFKAAYIKIEGEIESLEIRCKSLPKYGTVLDQLNTLESNVEDLEKDHKMGIDSISEVETIKSTFETQFGTMATLQSALKNQSNK